jgi:eukaryotic-like serine/threonine-protein kinase
LLDQALDLPAEERARWIAGLGPEAETMKARLFALLAHAPSVQGSGFLSAVPTVDIGAISGDEELVDQPGATIGPYRLLRTLGEGGMGTVWLAERTDGMIRRAVALKLPRGAWPRAEFVERMARERDILASLAHPHIERDAAEQVVRVLIELFETTNPCVRPDGDRMPVGEFLSGARERSLERLRATPAVRARRGSRS